MIRRWQIVVCAAAVLIAGPSASAQRVPEIGYIYPAGARQGSAVDVALAGRYLEKVTGAVVSGGGIQVSLVEHVKPLNGKDITLLRDRLKELQAQVAPKKGATKDSGDDGKALPNAGEEIDPEAVDKEMAEIKKKLGNPKNQNRENPQLAEDLLLRIDVSPDAAPGRRELRIETATGLSNPLVFYVGNLPEHNEKEPNEKAADIQVLPALPLIINGQVMPGDVDRFKIPLKKGMRLVVRAAARDLIPYLADGVPGWFQATLGLYDADGKEVAYVDDYTFNPDPVLVCEVPADGQYVLEIKDAIYRGREDFVYRITAGELPFVTSIFPLGGPAGAETIVEVKGWNLPQDKLTVNAAESAGGIIPVSVGKSQWVSNTLPFAVGTLPERLEQEPNDQPSEARKITLPIVINGRIERAGDCDVFCFEGRAGDAIVAEVHARRLESPLDSTIKLTDADGRTLIANDDHEDRGAGLITHHADSLISTTLPADGTYYLHLSDAQRKGGPDYGYRLRISPPQPDFELRIVPSTVTVRAGSTVPVTVHALRKDGFAGDITVMLKDAPEGFTLSGGKIAADKTEVKMSLKAPSGGMKIPATLAFEGIAAIDGRKIVRRAVPADNKMQAFFYWHMVCAEDFKVAVLGRAAPAKKPAANTAKPAPKPAAQTASNAKPAARTAKAAAGIAKPPLTRKANTQ
ncbi:MAG: PPC domain-containing protein [Phycisphaerae bacterium]|nr:PPC domain-containing protein [Phycisphaerae bacterium]